ncbi:MAG: GNAT family N-acetyltransferase [Clostridiales bacterium]|jgi:ribosomal protein S18 acetylase RimI-like enzyme|nr:GNAT family N-acetyltransferase [Clostridiales bacterium]
MNIRRIDEIDDRTGEFINKAFTDYAISRAVELNFDEYCIVAENDDGQVIGAITGRAYYNEVHIGDLIIDENYRGNDIGTKLVRAVEDAYRGKGYTKITLTTFGFQAPDFYKKLGYSLEFVREDPDPKLSKYFFCKDYL